jgi:hypothetical protein
MKFIKLFESFDTGELGDIFYPMEDDWDIDIKISEEGL